MKLFFRRSGILHVCSEPNFPRIVEGYAVAMFVTHNLKSTKPIEHSSYYIDCSGTEIIARHLYKKHLSQQEECVTVLLKLQAVQVSDDEYVLPALPIDLRRLNPEITILAQA